MHLPKSIQPKMTLHWDLGSEHFVISDAELGRLGTGGQSYWKDLCIASATIFLPTALNAIVLAEGAGLVPTVAVFLNSLVALSSLILSVAFGIAWRRTTEDVRSLLAQIRSRPAHTLELNEEAQGHADEEIDPENSAREAA